MEPRRTFPPPWTVHEADEAWRVEDANGFAIVWFCWGRETTSGTWPDRMTKDEARRMAVNFAKLPGLLRKRESLSPENP
jgi:hypothetical protein